MKKYCLKRLASILPTMFILSILLFSLLKIMPGDQVALSMNPNLRPDLYEESYEIKKERLGLNDQLIIQYINYMKMLCRGDLGYSSTYDEPVMNVIGRPLMNTLLLNGSVFVLMSLLSIYLGIQCALHKDSLFDRFMQWITTIGISFPLFLIASFIQIIFGLWWKIFPISGMPGSSNIGEWFYYLVLPVMTLCFVSICSLLPYIRIYILEILDEDYITLAHAKGLNGKVILYKHVLKNAMIPITTMFMSQLGTIFQGVLVIEILFSWEGMGSVLLKALHGRDVYLILSINLIYAFLYIICNVFTDILYVWLDPRVDMEKML